ncbi:MAG: divalent-cation tolerance protein CutA [Betaproteobacteria bacterium]|nr:divalent cation tolerance protein CutA [Betaproteobacteria bacterium]MDE2210346.1 divalent-cation tolerance protein CutA [Betaproteobacteria bacterium]MDE2360343.1 divalent-cation tolerance protein CutA [Betaproteobacteria bacterium]
MADTPIIVLTHVPDAAVAADIARTLVGNRLAACVNIGAPTESIYHWHGRIETASEVPLAVKTRSGLYRNVEAAIRDIHPYDTPEIIAIPVVDGDARFLAWIEAETATP